MGLKGDLNKEKLSYIVGELLELPKRHKEGKAWEITGAVIKAITNALQKGEEVYVMGFGTFKVVDAPHRKKHHCYFFPYLNKKGLHSEVVDLPPRKTVKFTPTDSLKRFVNEPFTQS